MTMCIASVCNHNEKEVFVIATDHMITSGIIGQFEHDIKKHKKVNEHNMAMLSGNALIFNELLSNIKEGTLFSEAKKQIFDNFVGLKKDYVGKQLLSKFGLNENEVREAVKGQIQNPFLGKLIETIAKFELGTNIMLVGFEKDKTHIAEIQENGYLDFSDIHFHAIGSGQIQALNTLLFQKQSKSDTLKTTIYNVYKAKRNAEVAAGVGKETDMLIMTENNCYDITKADLEKLATIYGNELNHGKNSEKLNELQIFNSSNIS